MSGDFPLNKGYIEDRGRNFAHRTLLGGGRVGTRIIIFIWLSLFSVALLGGGFAGLENKLTKIEQSLSAAKVLTALATGVAQQTLKLRNAVNFYLLDNDPKFSKTFDMTAKEINKNLNELYDRSDTRTVRDYITTINDGLAQYTDGFSKLLNSKKELSITETNILAGQVSATSKVLERTVSQLADEGGLQNVLAGIRRHEKNFLLHSDPRLLSKITNLGQEFDTLSLSNSQSDDIKAQLSDLMQLYQSHLTTFAAARITNKNNASRLNEIFTYMLPSVDGLSAFASNNLRLNQEKAVSIGALTRILLGGGGALLLFMLMIFGIILLRSLTVPINEAATAASQLVLGNLEVEIPALGNADEIGELARALAIFGATLDEILELRTEAKIARASAEDTEARLQEKLGEIKNEAEPIVEEEPVVEKEKKIQAQLLQRQEPETRPIVSSNALTGPISTISKQVAQSSKNVTDAAYEAERTGALTQGLTDAVMRLVEIKNLLSDVEEQADFLVFKPGSRFSRNGDTPGNLVVLSPENRSSSDQLGIGDEAVGKRFDIIRTTNTQISRAITDISELIGSAKNTAYEIASNSSEQALKITSDLLKQSEYLRWMLNEQVGKLEKRPDDYDEEESSSEYANKPPPTS
jgi:methyl-accepting chemotaxis protein